jgi:hypothetical protein
MNNRITPEVITELKENEIFVFGSNLVGRHGMGAANIAYKKFGAIYGCGIGIQGKTYAIPTKDFWFKILPIKDIKIYVDSFIESAKLFPDKIFLVTKIGCGLSGYEPKDIAPLFKEAIDLENVYLSIDFWNILKGDS